MKTPPIVSPQEWEAERETRLVEEKALTRARDAMAAKRRQMPWMVVEKNYRFEGPDGPASLGALFEGRRQLIVYRAFYGPEVTTYAEGGAYPERACVGCSFGADQVAHPAHLNARNTTLVFASRAPQAEIQGLKERHGWEHIPWYTITDDFDKDFDVDEWHGTNAFIRDGEKVFRPKARINPDVRPIFDAPLTTVVDGTQVKVVAWFRGSVSVSLLPTSS